VEWGPELLAFNLMINQSLNFGTTDDRTKELRKLFRDVKFRRALTQAIDRDGVAKWLPMGRSSGHGQVGSTLARSSPIPHQRSTIHFQSTHQRRYWQNWASKRPTAMVS